MRTGRFRRADRLRDSRDFRRVLRRGRRRASPDLVVLTCNRSEERPESDGPDPKANLPSCLPPRRLGITASRKVGNAVQRNRFKRLVREWFRRRRWDLPPGLDVVVIARRSGARLGPDELDEKLSGLLGIGPARCRSSVRQDE